MNYIHLWQLQLLVRFMLDESPMMYSRSSIAIAEEDEYEPVFPLNAVLGQITAPIIFSESVFNNDSSDIFVKISKKENISSEKIKEYLKSYITNFEQDNIVDLDYERNHSSYNTLHNEFLSSLNYNLNLKDYKIESKYLPVVLVGYFKDLVEINDYKLDLPLKSDFAGDNINVIERFVNDDFDCPVLLEDFMSMQFKADISRFVTSPTKTSKKKTPKKISASKLSKAGIIVLNKVEELKREGKNIIYYNELENILQSKIDKNKKQDPNITISKVISNVNLKYKQQHGKKLLGRKISETSIDGGYYEILDFPGTDFVTFKP